MDLKSYLTQADQVFSGGGDSCDYGCDEASAPNMIAYINEHFPDYRYCVVGDWTWLDVELKPEARALFEKRGGKPCFVFANKVIDDEAQRGFQSVRTTYLKSFHKNCIFISKNRAYILTGPGKRMTVDPVVFKSIVF